MRALSYLFMVMATFLNFNVGLTQNSASQEFVDLGSPYNYFDFWVGSWNVTWDEGNGKVGKGTNRIEKILDKKVIHERFEVTEGQIKGFMGTSISVYQPLLSRWKQAWADNNGGYYDFEGQFDGKNRIFITKPITTNDGKEVTSRMVFKNIEKNSFIWDWEKSEDGGKTWTLTWRINYSRKQE